MGWQRHFQAHGLANDRLALKNAEKKAIMNKSTALLKLRPTKAEEPEGIGGQDGDAP